MLTSLDAAREAVLSMLPEPEVVEVGVSGASGMYLAGQVRADRELPPADRSSMDGFAVRAADLESAPVELECGGEVAAGSDARPEVRPGSCVRIFTGANVPPGADTVAIVEHTEPAAGGRIRFLVPTARSMYIHRRGEDAKKGDVLLEKGTRLGASQICTCAAVGIDPVRVLRLPAVAVVCTGDELRAPSEDVGSHEIRNSNGPAVLAALEQAGVRVAVDLGGVRDDVGDIRDRIVEGLDRCDAVIVTGGVSKGDYDLVPAAVEAAGCRIHIHGVRMKPGKPFLFATGAGGGPVFGLPGNPLSVIVSFWEFVAPCLRAMMGDPEPDVWRIPARLTEQMRARGERTVLAPVRLWPSAGGGILASPVGKWSSGNVAAGGMANGTVKLEPETGVYPADAVVEAHPWSRPW